MCLKTLCVCTAARYIIGMFFFYWIRERLLEKQQEAILTIEERSQARKGTSRVFLALREEYVLSSLRTGTIMEGYPFTKDSMTDTCDPISPLTFVAHTNVWTCNCDSRT